MRWLALALVVGCAPTEEAPPVDEPEPVQCDDAFLSGDWALEAARQCVTGSVVERLHEVPEDAPGDTEGPPLPGIVVNEYRTANQVLSGESGRFVLASGQSDLMGVIAGQDGRVTRAFVQTWSSYADSGRGVEIDLPDASHELDYYEETFGLPWVPQRAGVFIHFYDPEGGSLAGAIARLASPVEGLVYEFDEEEPVPGDQVPEFSPDAQVLYAGVAPGDLPLEVVSPPGYDCDAPDIVPVLPNLMLDVWITCLTE